MSQDPRKNCSVNVEELLSQKSNGTKPQCQHNEYVAKISSSKKKKNNSSLFSVFKL